MPDPAADRSVASSEEGAASDAAPDASRRIDAARRVLVGELGGLDDTDAARLQSGDGAFARKRLTDLRGEKSWMLVVCVTMTVFAVVLPTAGLYQFFRAVDNLTPLELIGIIAATCAAGILLMIPPALVYGRWRRQRLCYDALRALDTDPEAKDDRNES